MKKALIVVDVQLDFCAGGPLEVPKGDEVVPIINDLMKSGNFDVIIATQDWHPADHLSFAENHPGKKVFDVVKLGEVDQVLWPTHCVQGTRGAQLHPDLCQDKIQYIIRKGMNVGVDSYSAFAENDGKTITGLAELMTALGVEQAYVCGLATDYCVKFTAIDANTDVDVVVVRDACRGVGEESSKKALEEMLTAGIVLINARVS